MAQTAHEGGEQKWTDGSMQDPGSDESQGVWDGASAARRIGELGVVETAAHVTELSLVEYMAKQAAAHISALSLINSAPRGSLEASAAVIENARIGRTLPDLGEHARIIAARAQELLCQYALDVSREVRESGTQDPDQLLGLLRLLGEISHVNDDSNTKAIIDAIRILNGIDSHPPGEAENRLAKLAKDLAAMRDGLKGEPQVPEVRQVIQ